MFLVFCFLNECWLYDFFCGICPVFFQRGRSLQNAGAKVRTKKQRRKHTSTAVLFLRVLCSVLPICGHLLRVFADFLRVFASFLRVFSFEVSAAPVLGALFYYLLFLNRSGMTGRVGCNEWTSWRRQRNVLTRTRVHPSQDDGSCWTKQRNVLPESTGHPRPDKGLPWPSGGTENGKWFILPRFPCGR